ncbi:hypothetical protein Tco_1355092 [Tanacetum coccineum]
MAYEHWENRQGTGLIHRDIIGEMTRGVLVNRDRPIDSASVLVCNGYDPSSICSVVGDWRISDLNIRVVQGLDPAEYQDLIKVEIQQQHQAFPSSDSVVTANKPSFSIKGGDSHGPPGSDERSTLLRTFAYRTPLLLQPGLAAGTPSSMNSSTNCLELLIVLFLTTFPALAHLASGETSDGFDTGLRFFS